MDLRSPGAVLSGSVFIRPPPQHVSARNIALSASVRDLLGSGDRLHRNGGPVGRACDFSLFPRQLVDVCLASLDPKCQGYRPCHRQPRRTWRPSARMHEHRLRGQAPLCARRHTGVADFSGKRLGRTRRHNGRNGQSGAQNHRRHQDLQHPQLHQPPYVLTDLGHAPAVIYKVLSNQGTPVWSEWNTPGFAMGVPGEDLAASSSFGADCSNWRRFVIAVIDFVRLRLACEKE